MLGYHDIESLIEYRRVKWPMNKLIAYPWISTQYDTEAGVCEVVYYNPTTQTTVESGYYSDFMLNAIPSKYLYNLRHSVNLASMLNSLLENNSAIIRVKDTDILVTYANNQITCVYGENKVTLYHNVGKYWYINSNVTSSEPLHIRMVYYILCNILTDVIINRTIPQ
jgi:hypothetical protein